MTWFYYGLSGGGEKDIETRLSVSTDQCPQRIRDSHDDVLVGDIQKGCFVFCNPVIRLNFSTGRAEAGFTGKMNDFYLTAAGTSKLTIAKVISTGENLIDVENDVWTNSISIGVEKFVPIVGIQENVLNR